MFVSKRLSVIFGEFKTVVIGYFTIVDYTAERRKQSLANVPTKKGYDRDEYPMDLCREGGKGADIRHIKPADNRGAGSYIGNKVEKLPDGAQVKIVVK